MGNEPVWSLLGIVIALTAYIATVRRRVLDKTQEDPAKNDPGKKAELFKYAVNLMWADVPLVVSGILIAVHNILLLAGIHGYQKLFWLGILFFGFALVVLAVFHASEWSKSIKKAP